MNIDDTDSMVMSTGKTAFVGKTLQFDGNIKGDENLVIEGTVEGTIILNNAEVTVAKDGFNPIHFQVKADEVDADARNTWLAAGVIWSPLWLGALFTKKFKDTYEFILAEETPHMTASAESAYPNESGAF